MCAEILIMGNKNGDHTTMIKNDKSNQYVIFHYNKGDGTSCNQIIELLEFLNISYTISTL